MHEVAKVGHRVDLAGQSAKGLGYDEAASRYFSLALANSYKCAGLFNNCDSFDVPRESKEALARLPKASKAETY